MDIRSSFVSWKSKHAAFWQFITFALRSCITSVVEIAIFALCNFLIFIPYKYTPFSWWLIDYSVENGGLCAFWSFLISFGIAQAFNFVLQRKTTFKASNNIVMSGILYTVMVLALYALQLYIPTLIRAQVVAWIGETVGDLLLKCLMMFISMLIQFPLNKYVIMRSGKNRELSR
ncbi:MAG: hypothetical protein IJA35_06885 [Clostridia bacterium]|nr:hypothetical protein [Clostridia bacterium]